MTGGSLAVADVFSSSQRAPIPFAQIGRAARVSAMRMPSDFLLAGLSFPESSSGSSSSSVPPPGPPASAPSSTGFARSSARRGLRTVDANYIWLNSLQLSLAYADIETTQHCIDEHTCREGNPLMPSSQAGKLGVSLGIAAFIAVAGYRLKRESSKGWWVAAAVGIAGHTVGLASGLAHR